MKSQNFGLTLIEVLVAMGIATVAGVLLLVIIVNSAGIFSEQSPKVSEGLSINDATSQIRSSIKQASSVDAGSTPSKLVLKVTSIDSSGNLLEKTYDLFSFDLEGTFLHFKISPDSSSSRKITDTILSPTVLSLGFTYLNSANPPVEVSPPDATKIRISLNLKTGSATTEANLRND